MITADEWENMHTEDYALEKEAAENLWHARHGTQEQFYIDQINVLLASGDEAAQEKLQALLQDTAFREAYGCRTQFAYLYVLLGIHEQERAAGLQTTILDGVCSLDAAASLVQAFRFLVWHIEFNDIEHSTDDSFGNTIEEDGALLSYITRQKLSPLATGLLVVTCAVSPQKMLLHLSGCLLDTGEISTAFDLLDISNELYPNHKLVMELLKQRNHLINI